MIPRRTNAGLSLVECLVVTAILAATFGFSMSFRELFGRQHRYATVQELQRLVQFTRSQAVHRGEPVTLCAVDDGRECIRTWSGRNVAVFTDANRDRRADDDELLHLSRWGLERGSLVWRAALSRRYLEYSPLGSTYQNGSFVWCENKHGNREGAADLVVSINRGGRPYLAEPGGKRCP